MITLDQASQIVNATHQSVRRSMDDYIENNTDLQKFKLIGDPTGQYLQAMIKHAWLDGYQNGQRDTGAHLLRTVDQAFDSKSAREELAKANQTGRVGS